MIKVYQTAVFRQWLKALKDAQAVVRINRRAERIADGNFGDARPVGQGVSELRIHYGPGYRIYFATQGNTIVLLLCGGDKSSQADDIKRAHELANEWRASR